MIKDIKPDISSKPDRMSEEKTRNAMPNVDLDVRSLSGKERLISVYNPQFFAQAARFRQWVSISGKIQLHTIPGKLIVLEN